MYKTGGVDSHPAGSIVIILRTANALDCNVLFLVFSNYLFDYM